MVKRIDWTLVKKRVGWGSVALLGLAAFIALGVHFRWGKSDWAAWVQAVGSILAIAATGWAVQHAHRLQERRDRQQHKSARVDRLEVLFKLVDSTVNSVNYIQNQLCDKPRLKTALLGKPNLDMGVLRTLGELLIPIPLHELDDPEVAFEILLITMNCKQLRELALSSIQSIDQMPDPSITEALNSMKSLSDQTIECRKNVRSRIESIKAEPAW